MSKRIYISGAITGTTDYMERFSKAEKELINAGYSVVNPAKINANLPDDSSYNEYMMMSLLMLSMCDSIYMLDGWELSNGARMEFSKAKELNMEIYLQTPEWKKNMYKSFITR